MKRIRPKNSDPTFQDEYTQVFDDFVATPNGPRIKPGQLYKYQEPWSDEKFLNAVTVGGLNNLSPAQWLRRGYDLATGNLTTDSWLNGNAGVVPNWYAQQHPYKSMAANALIDFWTLGGPSILKNATNIGKIKPLAPTAKQFQNISEQISKLKADNDAWIAAHPEYNIENILNKPKLEPVYDENIIRQKSRDLMTRQIDGYIEQHGLPYTDYTDLVQEAYQKQIVPRRAASYASEQKTNAVNKISKYLKDNYIDDVDFSTQKGLQMAYDNGWTFDEMADWSDYKQYIQKLQQYGTGTWNKYKADAWEKRYPINKETGSQVRGDYSTYNDKIRVVDDFDTNDVLLHESRHRMDNFIPLTKSERNTLINAYNDIWDDSFDEIVTTNSDLRNYLLNANKATQSSMNVQNTILNDKRWVSDDALLDALSKVNSYGGRAIQKMQTRLDNLKKAATRLGWDDSTTQDRIAEERSKIADAIRYAISTVGGTSAAIAFTKDNITE